MSIKHHTPAERVRAGTLACLRAATRAHHVRLEQRLEIFERLRKLNRRRLLLAGFLGFYEPAEARLARWLSPLAALQFETRRKAPLLVDDLRNLGMSEPELAAVPRQIGLGQLHSEAEALGFGYVLEGATLGGQVVCKHAVAIGLDPSGLSFFRSYGAAVGPMWRCFCDILETRCADPGSRADTVRGALTAFEGLEAWLLGRSASRRECRHE